MKKFFLKDKVVFFYPKQQELSLSYLATMYDDFYKREPKVIFDLIVMPKDKLDDLRRVETLSYKPLFLETKKSKYETWLWRGIPIINQYQFARLSRE